MAKKVKVLVAGTFDFLHPGHLHLLSQAKGHGSSLVVVVARDSTVESFKRFRPYFDERERLELVGSLSIVDKAVLGNPGDVLEIVASQKPDLIVLGYDQWPMEKWLKEKLATRGMKKTRIVRAKPYRAKKYKSSMIKEYFLSNFC